jgi:hypothetical protein
MLRSAHKEPSLGAVLGGVRQLERVNNGPDTPR